MLVHLPLSLLPFSCAGAINSIAPFCSRKYYAHISDFHMPHLYDVVEIK